MSNVANTLVRKSHLSREQLERQLKYQLKVSARLNTRLAQHAIDFKTLNDRCFTLLAERDASEGEAANHRNRVAVVEARLLIAKEALYNLYNACAISDSKEELPSDVDGSFMDAAREALSQGGSHGELHEGIEPAGGMTDSPKSTYIKTSSLLRGLRRP